MKTQKEIEDMKSNIQKDINEYVERMVRTNDLEILEDLGDRKRQLMAQYNILLEVLK